MSPQEFSIEIPDAEADEIKTVEQGMSWRNLRAAYPDPAFSAIDYIAKTPEGNLYAFRSRT
jgi:hypothetical protein